LGLIWFLGFGGGLFLLGWSWSQAIVAIYAILLMGPECVWESFYCELGRSEILVTVVEDKEQK